MTLLVTVNSFSPLPDYGPLPQNRCSAWLRLMSPQPDPLSSTTKQTVSSDGFIDKVTALRSFPYERGFTQRQLFRKRDFRALRSKSASSSSSPLLDSPQRHDEQRHKTGKEHAVPHMH